MNKQRLRNLTTGKLHTKMPHIYQDLQYITGIDILMTHMLPNVMRAVEPWLEVVVKDEEYWDGEYNPSLEGKYYLPPMTTGERKEFLARYGELPSPLFGDGLLDNHLAVHDEYYIKFKEENNMNNNINYDIGRYYVDISGMSKEEWDQLVKICDSKGINLYHKTYSNNFNYLCVDTTTGCYLYRCFIRSGGGQLISLLELFNRLETPSKTPEQRKIEELQDTIEQATRQINELKDQVNE